MPLLIRAAAPEDAETAAAVHIRSQQVAYAPFGDIAFLARLSVAERAARNAEWFAETPESGRRYWIAESDGAVVGICYTGPSRDEDATPGAGEVYTIYVDPEAWRTGAGRRLFEHAIADLHARGFDPLTLWVLAKNDRARRFYEIAGWVLDAGSSVVLPGQESSADPLTEVRYRAGAACAAST